MPNWIAEGAPSSEAMSAERQMNAMLVESLADLELALEDKGWERIGKQAGEFTNSGRKKAVELARVMAIANPLIKSGIGIRTGYIWGQGVELLVKDDPDQGQDVGAVVGGFLDDKDVQATFSGSQAREETERALATDGERFWALPTDEATGWVQVVPVDCLEITDIISDPENAHRPWFYKRDYVVDTIGDDGKRRPQRRTVYYPALGYRPARHLPAIDGHEVRWDQPMLHLAVNRQGRRGVGDAYAALPWAKASKEFLESWITLMKALSQFAWRASTKGSRVHRVASKALDAAQAYAGNIGQTAVMDQDTTLEAIPKTGATIDAESGRPIQMMVAAAFHIPVTMLLGDPGASGARAVAETLDMPTENAMRLRRELHTSAMVAVCDWVIDSAVRAGRLSGTVTTRGDRELVELPDNDSRTIQVTWPDFDATGTEQAVKAIVAADQTEKIPPLVTARLLLQALGERDIDDILETMTDEDGNWIPLDVLDSRARQTMQDRGEA